MSKLNKWVKFPSEWILHDDGLRRFNSRFLAAHTSALMCLMIIAHETDSDTGTSKVTYDHFQSVMGKSRAIVSSGLKALVSANLIESTGSRSLYRFTNYNPNEGWCKLPCKILYNKGLIPFFDDCNLRKNTELDAIKLFFLFAAFRNNETNVASISYEKITERAGIPRERIKRATALLAVNGVAFPEQMPSSKSSLGVSFGYRLAGIDTYRHQGTMGRRIVGL